MELPKVGIIFFSFAWRKCYQQDQLWHNSIDKNHSRCSWQKICTEKEEDFRKPYEL